MHFPLAPSTPLRARSRAAAGIALALLLGACASEPVAPTAALQAAQQAIDAADRARIRDQASPELHEAREKLAAAQSAVQEQHMKSAERLAQESRVDAELASALRAGIEAERMVSLDGKSMMKPGGDATEQMK